jgi:hypothetical protein
VAFFLFIPPEISPQLNVDELEFAVGRDPAGFYKALPGTEADV